ncbi:class I SAM-dependent methyltransferase [Mesonia aquimarina]|uniref:class I SAM-dependent methyltransferase n=1 Tax=Mesonia aquimarina TaxID=1504967 RepID=UPI000EF602BC|nr:class I SAM-dependent methyltransferase [Mesonia aquimarina]
MKDNFSKDSDNYAKYRPQYPTDLYEYLFSLCNNFEKAWDCGTGNGQIAKTLAEKFKQVEATDISENQLKQAPELANINYSIQQAEKTNFPDHQFNLITVAQAIHWFEFNDFYKEVKRTLQPNGILAVIGYGLLTINPEIDKIIHHFYENIISEYWDKERKYIEENYQTIPFPFKELETPSFEINYKWNAEDLLNYLNTWSAVKHYQEKNNENPIQLIINEIQETWGNKKREVKFPILLRIGKNFS